MPALIAAVVTMAVLMVPPTAPCRADASQVMEAVTVRVRYAVYRRAAAERAAAASPVLMAALEDATGLRFDFRPTVVLADRSDFAKMGGRTPFVAFALPERQRIVLDISRFDRHPELFPPVLKHEFAHLLLHRHIGSNRLPRWLDEGIAQYLSDGLSEYLPGQADLILGEALAAGRVFSLAALETRFPADGEGLQLAYEQSRSVVGYMAHRYGDAFVPALIQAMAGGLGTGEAFRTAGGISLAAFEADWRRHQKTLLAWLGRVAGHVYGILFFLAGLAVLIGFLRYRLKRRDYAAAEDDDA